MGHFSKFLAFSRPFFFKFFKKSISRYTQVILWLGSAELAMIRGI
jgi:hypothetical protein